MVTLSCGTCEVITDFVGFPTEQLYNVEAILFTPSLSSLSPQYIISVVAGIRFWGGYWSRFTFLSGSWEIPTPLSCQTVWMLRVSLLSPLFTLHNLSTLSSFFTNDRSRTQTRKSSFRSWTWNYCSISPYGLLLFWLFIFFHIKTLKVGNIF